MREVAIFALAVAVAGCSSDDTRSGSGEGECPNMGGAWTLTQHCEPNFVGQTMQASQTGCTYTASSAGFSCSGTVASNGSISQSCDVGGGQTITCSGQLGTSEFALDCTGDCHVEGQRAP